MFCWLNFWKRLQCTVLTKRLVEISDERHTLSSKWNLEGHILEIKGKFNFRFKGLLEKMHFNKTELIKQNQDSVGHANAMAPMTLVVFRTPLVLRHFFWDDVCFIPLMGSRWKISSAYFKNRCYMSHVMRKPVMPYANNKGADQPAHSRSLISAFVVRILDSIIPLVSICKLSRL